jgi:predicted GNAT superfamily acetyltransferase
VNIQQLTDYSQLAACVDFQRLIWGRNYSDVVPASVLWVAVRTGGLVAGAFDDADQLVGFLFGITGFVEGRPTHWSDMLAVHPRARGHGVGRALKEFQRATLLAAGIDEVRWTFDPLETRNAHLNFARLGITVREYVPDCYGDSNSPLHVGLATDRLVASWALASDRVRSRLAGQDAAPTPESIAPLSLINDAERMNLDLTDSPLRLRVPAAIQKLKQVDRAAAVAWRAQTRTAFTAYFERGYEAVEFVRDSDGGCYILARG